VKKGKGSKRKGGTTATIIKTIQNFNQEGGKKIDARWKRVGVKQNYLTKTLPNRNGRRHLGKDRPKD